MGLFKPDFYRSLIIGFVLGAVGMVAFSGHAVWDNPVAEARAEIHQPAGR
ncbi:MAG: hypothetical protein ACK5NN_12530 [Sphingomonadaceae bacterium]